MEVSVGEQWGTVCGEGGGGTITGHLTPVGLTQFLQYNGIWKLLLWGLAQEDSIYQMFTVMARLKAIIQG